MRHIKRPIEFNNKDKVNHIIAKFKKSGYISKSDQKVLDKVGYGDGFVDDISNTIDDLILFFDKYDEMEWENMLMEFFDTKPYTYNATCYIKLTDGLASWQRGNPEFSILLTEEYWSSDNKKEFLLSRVLKKINETKYNKLIISPRVLIRATHRDYGNYWDDDVFPNGIMYKDQQYLSKSICRRCESFIPEIEDVHVTANNSSYSRTPDIDVPDIPMPHRTYINGLAVAPSEDDIAAERMHRMYAIQKSENYNNRIVVYGNYEISFKLTS